MNITIDALVNQLQLQPHPEGGYFKETYRSAETIAAGAVPNRFNGERYFSTAIYFLLTSGNFSAFHRIQSDECWHFYAGDPLHVYVIHPDGATDTIRLGNNISSGEVFQAVVPAGCWFASETTGEFSFVGCTVSPGFDFADFELADGAALAEKFPQHQVLINRLCR